MMSAKSMALKVILLGNSGVGKTSIINKYVKNVFSDNLKPTIGVDFANKPIYNHELKSRSTSCDGNTKLNNTSNDDPPYVMLQIWDTMG
jgi:GTPase SAR1 family protein